MGLPRRLVVGLVAAAALTAGAFFVQTRGTSPNEKSAPVQAVYGTLQAALQHQAIRSAKPFSERTLDELIDDFGYVDTLRQDVFDELEQGGIDYKRKPTQQDLEDVLRTTVEYMRREFPPSHRMVFPDVRFQMNEEEKVGHYHVEGHSYIVAPLNFNAVSIPPAYYNMTALQGFMAHEAAHAQDIRDETDAQILAWEVLATRAKDGDLLAAGSLIEQLRETLYNYVFRAAVDTNRLAELRDAINYGGLIEENEKIAHVEGHVYLNYQHNPLLLQMAAAGGEAVTYKGILLDSIYEYLGRLLFNYRAETEPILRHFSTAIELTAKGHHIPAEPLFEITADLAGQLAVKSGKLKSGKFQEIKEWAQYYLADIYARRGDIEKARELLQQLPLNEIRGVVYANGLLPSLATAPNDYLDATVAELEREYIGMFGFSYGLDAIIDDYKTFRALRLKAEEELLKRGINPYHPVTEQQTLEEQLEKALPYVWAEFASKDENVSPRISFIGPDEYTEDKARKEAIKRKLQVMITKPDDVTEVRINNAIPLHDLSEAVSFASAQHQASASGKAYWPLHIQLISYETLANRANDGDLVAEHELLLELEFAAWELSLLKATERNALDAWAGKVNEGIPLEDYDGWFNSALSRHAKDFEINPYLQVMRILRGDTAGGFRFNSGRIELDGLASYLPGLTGRLPALPER